MAEYRELTVNGLWKNNPALVQLLGLCPLLGVTNSVVNAIGLGLATIFVLVASNSCVSLIRNVTPDEIRLPAFVMIIAAAVTCTELLMQAFAFQLYVILGIFLPLITTNCVILGRADGYARKNPLPAAAYDGLIMGIGFAIVLVLLGAARELLGTGGIFANMDLLFGPTASGWHWVVNENYPQFLLAVLPPGAFILTGLLIALKNVIDGRVEKMQAAKQAPIEHGSKRVRVTGTIS
ncbi:MAG: electron transport complex subunit E [Gammaproteobacteria bacterium]|nr:electron transport complex subunit E [Gammaproteobacteria bacterium]MBT8151325.1 electron transport complex subunit E [Gammaproteobacteria bacterium]NND39495.1 electron transport complex subunit E [Pseudomonadales bacterium]NNM10702.1 electron transport complex subunit E [Pseudomonadales bacterium]RZV55026.1 MAG: electron transport complex subunit E [Pseudomonadales bacterium]